eukprot:TRINITY_DN1528_c0_g1_i5.p2 TRINITY_DN1528_c0_g1~~TRINITY_DN1528_c0_g1_i5.p2  ORF type:complete len:251 (+),score=74.90 TRINITY_DN1528_c0_g1_i5:625-1377(+)
MKELIDYEIKMTKIREEEREKKRLEEERERERRKCLAQKQRESEIVRKQREEERKMQEKQEAELQRQKAIQEYEMELERIRSEKRRQEKRQAEAKVKEQAQRSRQEDFKKRAAEMLREQQEIINKKIYEAEKRDLELKLAREKAALQRNIEAEQKRRETENKVTKIKEMTEMVLEEQRKVTLSNYVDICRKGTCYRRKEEKNRTEKRKQTSQLTVCLAKKTNGNSSPQGIYCNYYRLLTINWWRIERREA